jgi:hypothetical protein
LTFSENDFAVWYEGPLAIDGDGGYRTYGPKGSQALDYLANAGSPGNYYGIITDLNGSPVIQGPNDPYPGMFISPTSLQDRSKLKSDPYRYVDSESVPYLAIAKDIIKNHGVGLGDVGFAYNIENQAFSPAIVADAGPAKKYGEGSIALAKALGIQNVSPKNGVVDSGIICFVFKGSKRNPAWPKTNAELAEEVRQLIDGMGGLAVVLASIGV